MNLFLQTQNFPALKIALPVHVLYLALLKIEGKKISQVGRQHL